MGRAEGFSCFIIGSDSLVVECADILLARGHDVRGIITDTDRLAAWARERGVPHHPASGDLRAALAARPFDWLFSITHLAVIPADVLRLPARGAVNFHDGPLPRYAGLNTPAWGLMNGEQDWGITFHLMTDQVDQGDVLTRRSFPIASRETSLTLNARCFEAAIDAFGGLVDDLAAGRFKPSRQDRAPDRFYTRHQRPDAACVLDSSRPAAALDGMVRALDFGRYTNPVGAPKIYHANAALLVTAAEPLPASGAAAPGTIASITNRAIEVVTGDGRLAITGLAEVCGSPVEITEAVSRWRLAPGMQLDRLPPDSAPRLTEMGTSLSRAEPCWVERLRDLRPLELDGVAREPRRAAFEPITAAVSVPAAFRERFRANLDAALRAAAGVYLSVRSGAVSFDAAYTDSALSSRVRGLEVFLHGRVPVRFDLDQRAGFEAAIRASDAGIEEARRRGPFLRDLLARYPELHAPAEARLSETLATSIELHEEPDAARPAAALTLVIARGELRVVFDPGRVQPEVGRTMAAQISALLAALAEDPSRPLRRLDLLSDRDRTRVLSEWNNTARPVAPACVHQLIERQAARTPDAPALSCGAREVSYAELNARANRLAHYLRSLGVGPDARVGVCVERSSDMVVAVLGVLKAGGAYVPIDPGYPAERTRFVIEDADAPVLLTQDHLLADLPKTRARVICMDADWPAVERHSGIDPAPAATPEHLAYVIYTSGSTGKPKGVMVEHRNAVNFFAAMDDRLPAPADGAQGVWLAVTSLSFDISVLELLWTLTRGYKVVIHTDPHRRRAAPAPAAQSPRPEFSLFFFAADEGGATDKYKLLLEAARFADRHGFSAVWTPERHFHAFGGLYPNPAVASAALAFVTERVQLRAGSVVLPLHHPARVAEDWALVDNLSRGRVAVSFASGWQPVDFVLRPETYEARHKVMYEAIEIVRRLWRGEAVAFPNASGGTSEIRTLPRPVQRELPIWITSAGSIDTWKSAAQIGANILTHLLGQTPDEIAAKIKVYRELYAAHNPGKPPAIVSVMLHTFVGDDDASVKAVVRRPMINYLRTSLSLVKNVASAWAAFKKGAAAGAMDIDLKTLSPEEMDGLLEFSFERYYETSGLFGSVETCLRMIERLREIGVDEIACLLDFGVDADAALRHLEHLNTLRERAARGSSGPPPADPAETIGGLIRRHKATHLQCTPSMARMVLMGDDAPALAGLQTILIGGEAFPSALARDLAAAAPEARILNMYGPTETTVWSSMRAVSADEPTVPIGQPIANTELYVLDAAGRPVPIGVTGELYIGGAGVVRGYLNRPELTAERFVPDPFDGEPGARLYRTGDLARWTADGEVEYLGRADQQVKVRGYRIELGEIEAAAAHVPGVGSAAVTLREDTPGDQRLIAYIVRKPGDLISADDVKAALRRALPDFMVPSHVVFLSALPLTPNKKVDRRALPKPDDGRTPARDATTPSAPASDLEQKIGAVWGEVLGLANVGVNDNFFDLGGHSLLAVKAHRRLKEVFQRELAITDLFRFPTVRALAGYFQQTGNEASAADEGLQRGEARRELLARRRAKVRAGGGAEGDQT